MNVDVEIVLFILGFIIGSVATFAMSFLTIKQRIKPDTRYVVIRPTKKPQNDDWKTYERYYESEEK